MDKFQDIISEIKRKLQNIVTEAELLGYTEAIKCIKHKQQVREN